MRLLVLWRENVVVVGAPCHSLGQRDDETHHEVLDDPEDGARGGPHAPHHPLHPSSRSRGDSLLKRKEHSLKEIEWLGQEDLGVSGLRVKVLDNGRPLNSFACPEYRLNAVVNCNIRQI